MLDLGRKNAWMKKNIEQRTNFELREFGKIIRDLRIL